MESDYILALIEIAKKKGGKITSVELGNVLDISQQTASRRMKELEKLSFIRKEGKKVIIEERGMKVLKEIYLDLDNVFREQKSIYGKLFSGLGEGKYYISKHGYREQLIKKLGFSPYPGTLNLYLSFDENKKLEKTLTEKEYTFLNGFRDENRTFGDVRCYKILIENQTEGALLKPFRTHHMPNVAEIISKEFLRKKLKINDGSMVSFFVL
jgi:riboflavin kinase